MKQTNDDIISKENFLITNLKVMGDIHFTNREIDIIACLLGSKTYKNIASMLVISPKTVELHVRNIMLKLKCNSRDNIINIIEKSDKFAQFKTYYLNILIKKAFKKNLSEFSLASTNNIHCLILSPKKPNGSTDFITLLEKDLALAGIKVFNQVWEREKTIQYFFDSLEFQHFDYVIYVITTEFKECLQKTKYTLREEALALLARLEKKSTSIVFLSLDLEQKKFLETNENLSGFIHLNLKEQENYYFLVLELLQKFSPTDNISKNIIKFKKQYRIIHNLTISPDLSKVQALIKKITNDEYHSQTKKKSTLLWALFFLFFIGFSITIFNVKKELKFINKNVQDVDLEVINNEQNVLVKTNTMVFNLPPHNIKFTGRQAALTQIKTQFNKQKTDIITQAIYGLGGVGKTQLATEFAYQSRRSGNYSAIFWIPSETDNTIGDFYKELAANLSIDIRGLDLDNIQTLVHDKLAINYQNSKILLILDNVSNQDDIDNYLTKVYKELSPFLIPHILITSRSQFWSEASIVLDVFTPEEALAFVRKYLSFEKIATINQLTKELHFFPLAIEQAATYIKKHTNIDDYLKLYTAKQKDYLNKFPEDKNQYHETLWKTWNITVEKLSAVAKDLLFLSAYLDPDNIPFAFFDHLSIEQRANGIEELRKYSFILLTNHNHAFKIHRLLQEVIRLSIKDNSENESNFVHTKFKTDSYWVTKAMNLLKTKFDANLAQPKKWKDWNKYLSQAQSIATHAIAIPGNTFQQGIRLLIKTTIFLTCIQCDGKKSIEGWKKLLYLAEQYYKGQGAKFILASINTHLSNSLVWSGNYQQALEILNTKVIPVYQKPYPNMTKNEHELLDLLRIIPFKDIANNNLRKICDFNFSLSILGEVQYKLGFMQEALASYNKAIKIFQRAPQDKISQYYKVDTLGDLGNLYINVGEFVKAEITLKKAKKWTDKIYVNHPRQARIYADLAFLMYNIGEFAEAEQLLVQCAKIRHNHLSPHHIRHSDTQLKFGFINFMLNNLFVAKQNFIEAEKIYKLYNAEQSNIFIALGFWKIYEALGEYNKAIDYMKITLKMASLRYKHKINQGMLFQLTQAELWPKLTKSTSISYWQIALKITKQLFGNTDYQSAKYHYLLGQAFEYESKVQEAIKHYNQALIILNAQTIRHPNLNQFYLKNYETIKLRLDKLDALNSS